MNRQQDTIIRAMLMGGEARLIAISGTKLVETARVTHGLSRTCTAALGRQLLMTAMLASELKNQTDTVTTIISGGGPTGNLICVGRHGNFVKGCIGDPNVELPPTPAGKLDVSGAIGKKGKLTVVRDLSMKEPYAGTCNLISGEIAEDFAQYFTVSEQQPSLVYLGVRVQPENGCVCAAGGLLVQPLPGCTEETLERLQERSAAISNLTQQLDEGRLLLEILKQDFDGLDVVLIDQMETAFHCDCCTERLERALISLGEAELTDLIQANESVELTCHFCNRKYDFSIDRMKQLLEEARHSKPEEV